VAACHLFFFQPGRCEGGDDFSEQGIGLRAVVAAVVADINVERGAGDFRPGMQGEVRFSKDDSPGDAGWLTVRVVKGGRRLSGRGAGRRRH